MAYEEHHIGLTTSRLVELPGIDLVHTFPLDYMHLVCLGVVRKLILLWLHKGPIHTRLPGLTVKKLSASLLANHSYLRILLERQGISRKLVDGKPQN